MAYTRLSFTRDWTNALDFPTYEDNEAQVRADFQQLHNETKSYLNGTLLPQLEAGVSQAKTFLNVVVAVTAWQESEDVTFPYYADLTCSGVTVYDVPIVTFRQEEAQSMQFSAMAYAGAGFVRIYANEIPDEAITISSILCAKGG